MKRPLTIAALLCACGSGSPAAVSGAEGTTSSGGHLLSSDDVDPLPGDEDTTQGLDDGGGNGPKFDLPPGECEVASDCRLVDTCCQCGAIPVGEVQPQCGTDCVTTECVGNGLKQATCSPLQFGSCIVATDCDPVKVCCPSPPPPCTAAELPVVLDGCWGQCIPATSCTDVGSCDRCPESLFCMEWLGDGQAFCVPVPPGCAGPTDCSCVGHHCAGGRTSCYDTPDGPKCDSNPFPG